MNAARIAIAVLTALGGATLTAASEPSLAEAHQAFAGHRIHEAYELYGQVAASAAAPADRREALHLTALLEWRYLQQPEAARARLLNAATSDPTGASDFLAEVADLELAREQWPAARAAAARALLLAGSTGEARAARLRWARATVEEAAAARRAGAPASGELLADAVEILAALVADEPGDREPSRLLVAAGLLAGRGETTLSGWQSFFRLTPGAPASSVLAPAQAELEALLPAWCGVADQVTAERLVRALAGSRLFAEAALLAADPAVSAATRARVADLVAYAELVREVATATDEYYRRIAIGEETTPADLMAPLLTATIARWTDLRLPGEPPALAPNSTPEELLAAGEALGGAVEETLAERYGSYVNVGSTAGYFDLHWGHVVADEQRTIEQYGEVAEVRFVLLDAMVSNGFQSWAWAYRSQHGGWAKPDAIYQVRPAYADGPVRSWRQLTDPVERAEWDEEIARASAGEMDVARANPTGYLPGLTGRLRRASLNALHDELAARGLAGRELRTAFLAELEEASRDWSIFAHEGRHAIDRSAGIEGSEELELRAKLSEIAFARLPRSVLAGPVLGANLGDPTPHGQANQRIAEGLTAWMAEHAEEIPGLDPRQPLLPQLDLLTPEQIRRAARAMDPLAQAS